MSKFTTWVRTMRRWWVVLVSLLAVIGLGTGAAAGPALQLGARAPDVAGERWVNSGPLTTAGLRGRVVLVEFWTYG